MVDTDFEIESVMREIEWTHLYWRIYIIHIYTQSDKIW